MLYRRIIFLVLTTLMVLTGCQTPPLYNQTESNVADVTQKSKEALLKSDAAGKLPPSLLINQGLYVDKTPINLAKDPSWTKNHIELRGDQLPFSYYSRTIVGGAHNNILSHYQVGLDQASNISINYSGTVKGALDLISAKTGYVYTINGDSIYWQAFITKTFDIAFMPGTVNYNLGDSSSSQGGGGGSSGGGGGGAAGSGGGGGGGGSSSGGLNGLSSSSTLSAKVDLWQDLDTTIKTLLSPDGKVIVSQATTTVTVRDKPTNVDLVGKYIRNLNVNLSKQVLVKIQVYEVTLTTDFNFGIDWTVVKRAFMGTNFILNANYGTPVSISPQVQTQNLLAGALTIPAQHFLPTSGVVQADPLHTTGANMLISALQEQGKVSVVSEPRVVCLNNQVSVISIVDKQGYAASVSSTALAGGTGAGGSSVTSSITPGTLTTGLILYVLPKIMGNKVYLQVNADLSNNLGTQTFTSGGSSQNSASASIETPHISEKEINQRSVITSGDTLILSGFRKVSNQSGAMQLYDSQSLGGKAATQANTETVVLITPIILNGTV